jgi:hypothetical protein
MTKTEKRPIHPIHPGTILADELQELNTTAASGSMPLIAATLFKRDSYEIQRISSLHLHSATIPCPPSGDKLFVIFAFNRNREVVTQLAITALQISESQIECWQIQAISCLINNK